MTKSIGFALSAVVAAIGFGSTLLGGMVVSPAEAQAGRTCIRVVTGYNPATNRVTYVMHCEDARGNWHTGAKVKTMSAEEALK